MSEIKKPVSIGICCYNEEKNIEKLLVNLLKEQYLHSLSEIIIVSSGSKDNTNDIVNKFAYSPQIRLIIEEERNGKSSAVNIVLKSAKREFILFLPADVIPQKGSINSLLNKFQNSNIGIVGGCPIPINGNNDLMGNISRTIWSLHNRTLSYLSTKGCLTHISGEFFIIAKGIVEQIPSFIINDDAYMAIMTVNKGKEIIFDKKARVFIKGPNTVYDYFVQRRRVVFGHKQISRLGIKNSNALENMTFSKPHIVIKILYEEIKEYPQHFIFLFIAIFLEIFVNLYANIDIIRKKSHLKWEVAESTK